MKKLRLHVGTSYSSSHRQGKGNGPNDPNVPIDPGEDDGFLENGIGRILIAYTDFNPDGQVMTEEGRLVDAINFGLTVNQGDQVIVVSYIESTGWEIELYLDSEQWEDEKVI